MWNVLVTDTVHEAGLAILEEAGDVKLVRNTGLSRPELLEAVKDADAMMTRSGTPLDREVLQAAEKLRVVARAGVGVDNIDIAEASRRGVVVINAPTGNTLAATEHTFAVMLGLLRRVPHAHASVSGGEWDRKRFMGSQLHGKRLLIVGFGRIGSRVAARARAFGMKVTAYDPYVGGDRMRAAGAEPADDLSGALALADVVTLHVPLTAETGCMIDAVTLRAFKKGSLLINCARGGLVDEKACAEALREGRLGGAGFDVFSKEPPNGEHPLMAEDIRDRVVLTPHIGANTREAQSAVSEIAASNLLGALRGESYEHAVNLPFMEQNLPERKRAFLSLSRKMGALAGRLCDGPLKTFRQTRRGETLREENGAICFENPFRYSPYMVASLKGLLEVRHGADVNYMSAPLLADESGLEVEESKGETSTYRDLLELHVKGERGEASIMGTVTEEGKQRIVNVNGYWIDFVPDGGVILFQNHDRPGVIGKIGMLLGSEGVNIANFALGRRNGSGLALGVLQIDGEAGGGLLDSLGSDVDMLWAIGCRFEEGL